MCVGVSIGEGGADSERMLPPPLVKDDVIDLNHELRFADFWRRRENNQMCMGKLRGWEWRTGLEGFPSEDLDVVRWGIILKGSFSLRAYKTCQYRPPERVERRRKLTTAICFGHCVICKA